MSIKAFLLLSLLLIPTLCGDVVIVVGRGVAAGGGGITPPSFIAEQETAWNTTTSPKNGSALSVQIGDVLVNCGVKESDTGQLDTPVNSGTALTWTQQKVIRQATFTEVRIWTAVATAAESITVTNTRSGSAAVWGATTLQFRGGSVGASATNVTAETQPAVALTTTQDNSAVVVVNGDFDATDGAVRTWRTVNSVTPSSGNGLEKTYFRDAAAYALYIGIYDNVGTAGANTYGITAPAGQDSSIAVLEVKGQ